MLLVAMAATLFAINGMAFTPPPAPEHGGYVSDQTGRMSVRDIQELNQKIDRISRATKNEFGILLLQDMDGDNIEDAAQATWKSWGIGKRGLDNGVLILVALKERKSRIQTGKGVEGDITDLQTQDILKQHLNPHLKKGDFYGGFAETLDTLSALMSSRANQQAAPAPVSPPQQQSTVPVPQTNVSGTPDSGGSSGVIWFVLVVLGVLVSGVMLAFFLSDKAEEEKRRREAQDERELEAIRRRREEENDRYVATATTPYIPVPSMPPRQPSYPSYPVTSPFVPEPPQAPAMKTSHVVPAVAAAAVTAVAVEELYEARERAEARERERERAAEERRTNERREEARRAREREEEDDRRRRRDDDSSSSSSSSSFDWGGSSSDGGGSNDGGGFGGGDSGGGGSSSDF